MSNETRYISVDLETALTLPSLQAPPVACLTWSERRYGRLEKGILQGEAAVAWFARMVENRNVVLVGHNIQYDIVCMLNWAPWLMAAVFAMYEADRVQDTMLRAMLINLSWGKLQRPKGYYGLANLCKPIEDLPELDKVTWRTGYGKLVNVPLHAWPQGAIDYAEGDAVATLRLFEEQGGAEQVIHNIFAQCRAGFVFQLMRCWGMRTDQERVEKLETELTAKYNALHKKLRGWKILRPDGVQDMAFTRELIEASYPGLNVPLTKGGKTGKRATSTAGEVLELCTHPGLQDLAQFKGIQKTYGTFLPVVKRGVYEPICPYVNTLVKNGRSSYRDPNLQQIPRKGGVRECFVPRPGKVFVNADYDTLEVRTLAQVLLDLRMGRTLADLYRNDPNFDPHTRLASQMFGCTYEEGLLHKANKTDGFPRNAAKAGNFGLAGGMGIDTFVKYAWTNYGVRLTHAQAQALKNSWLRSVPEMGMRYFPMCSRLAPRGHRATIQQLRSLRIRGGLTYTDLANTYWSGLAADGAKQALWDIAKACYVKEASALYGSRLVVYIHDEFMLESDFERGHECGMELQRIGRESMETHTPDVPSRMSSVLMERWYKGADPVFDQHGRLTLYRPKEAA